MSKMMSGSGNPRAPRSSLPRRTCLIVALVSSIALFLTTALPVSADVAEFKLTASDGAPTDFFGRALAVSGDAIVVGASGNDDNGSASGSAYVYRPDHNGGYTETKLTASDAAELDQFGAGVAVSGDTIAVGANAAVAGAVYLYRSDDSHGYIESKLTSSDGADNDSFGRAVAMSGETIVVGASGDGDNGSRSGSAYVYQPDGSGGYTEYKLTASDGAEGDLFGRNVEMSGDTLVIGADGYSSLTGAVYVYRHDTVLGLAGDD